MALNPFPSKTVSLRGWVSQFFFGGVLGWSILYDEHSVSIEQVKHILYIKMNKVILFSGAVGGLLVWHVSHRLDRVGDKLDLLGRDLVAFSRKQEHEATMALLRKLK